MYRHALLLLALLIFTNSSIQCQVRPSGHNVVSLPNGTAARVPSPSGRWTLVFECPNDCKERKLWIEDNANHARKLVNNYERSLDVAWAPDGQRFFVNDNYGSNGSLAYVIDPAALKTTDLGMIVTKNDARAKVFLRTGHSYLKAENWLSSHELLVILSGHFDDPPPRAFNIQYRVNLNGTARKVSQQPEEEP